LARPSNLLVLDEPTNDLDMDTLDLLQETLDEYEGTLLIVSHDRDFLDRLANGILSMRGDGTVEEFAGGYSDYLLQSGGARDGAVEPSEARKSSARSARGSGSQPRASRQRLSYRETQELDGLPAAIEHLTATRATLERELADPSLYSRDRARFEAAMEELAGTRAALERAEARWLELAEREEELATGRK
ncbi:MAG TPA: ABC transporter ATP-binding protein, partial [Alphaproteobacteria bacterium]|nr:ABC transporter ATP-binding protein [Alphaproteobacteria bacterium]